MIDCCRRIVFYCFSYGISNCTYIPPIHTRYKYDFLYYFGVYILDAIVLAI